MDQRLSFITLGVSDIKKARAFYDAMSWKAVESPDEEIVCYNLQHMALALYPWTKLADDAQVPIERTGCSAVAIAHNVDSDNNVDEILKEAERSGGKIVKLGQKVFWGGYSGYFCDPDGHLWEVAHNPFFKLGPNGEFQWGGVK
jgi:uncharacterized protein